MVQHWRIRGQTCRLTHDLQQTQGLTKSLKTPAYKTQLSKNYFSSLVQLKYIEKRLAKEEDLTENNSGTLKEDLDKGYVI